MNFRYATKNDAKLLAEVGAETFWDTYHNESVLELEFIKVYISQTFTEEVISQELEGDEIIYLIPEIENEVCGFARLLPNNTREQISGKNPFQISRIYLRKNFWSKGLGKKLMQRCIEEAKKHDSDVVWLSVWKQNARAIKFYEKFDFYRVGEHIFDLAGDSQIDDLMQKNL